MMTYNGPKMASFVLRTLQVVDLQAHQNHILRSFSGWADSLIASSSSSLLLCCCSQTSLLLMIEPQRRRAHRVEQQTPQMIIFEKIPHTHTHSLIDGVVSPELTSRSAHNSGGGKGSSSNRSSQRICVLFFLEEPLGLQTHCYYTTYYLRMISAVRYMYQVPVHSFQNNILVQGPSKESHHLSD